MGFTYWLLVIKKRMYENGLDDDSYESLPYGLEELLDMSCVTEALVQRASPRNAAN
jgi:hypothetical protein